MLRIEHGLDPEQLDDEKLLQLIRDLILIEKTRNEMQHITTVNSIIVAWNKINGKGKK